MKKTGISSVKAIVKIRKVLDSLKNPSEKVRVLQALAMLDLDFNVEEN